MLQRLFQSAVCNDEPTTISMKTKSQLTRSGVSSVGLVDTLSKDNSEAGFQMPVDVAVEEPRTRIVRLGRLRSQKKFTKTDCEYFIPRNGW